MAVDTLLRRHYTSLSYHPYPSVPLLPKPHFSVLPIPPLNPPKTPFPLLLTIPLQTNRSSNHRAHFASSLDDPHSDEDSSGERLDDAIEAVRDYLEQAGASTEDASRISSNCPNYVSMLIHGVDDLDDWNSMTAGIQGDSLQFKQKVRQMADRKGDNGILPFLESIGLSLSSATHLARYVSASDSSALPRLIHKVNYVKEILFFDSDDHVFIGKNARRMLANLSISADEDVQHTLAFFQKIQARRGGLSLLGSEHTSFRHLIESFPRILLLPLQSHIQPLVKFLEVIGVPKGQIRNILLLFPPVLLYTIDMDIKPRLQSFKEIGVNNNDLGKMLVKYPWIISDCILDNFEKVLNFFDEEKVPRIYTSNAIKNWPHILGCSIKRLKVMVEQFSEMGIKGKKLGHVIATSPQLLLCKPQEFYQVVSFFEELGLDEEAIAKTVGRCPEIYASNIEKTLEKKLEFLYNVGISKTFLPRVMRYYPEIFVCDVDRALLVRIMYLMKSGLPKKDIRFMVSQFPPLLGYSIEEVLRPKIEFLVYTMGKPLSSVVDYPRYFSYSLEKKIKPRYQALKQRNIELSLKEMLGKNDEEFAGLYMGVEELFVPPS